MNSLLGFDKVAELLIQNGADVSIVGQDGTTALTLASRKGKTHTSTLLLTLNMFIEIL